METALRLRTTVLGLNVTVALRECRALKVKIPMLRRVRTQHSGHEMLDNGLLTGELGIATLKSQIKWVFIRRPC